MREFVRGAALSLVATIACASGAMAETPFAAVVEDIDAPSTSIQFMDYVKKGQMIVLGPNGSVTLGYFQSCMQETITGGVAIIGKERSSVSGGLVEREEVECDNSILDSFGSTAQTGYSAQTADIGGRRRTKDSAVVLMRSLTVGSEKKKASSPQHRIYGLSPVFKLSKSATQIRISRIDGSESDRTVAVRGKHVDLAKLKIALKPGLYSASAGGASIQFRVDLSAKPGRTSILSRLIRL